MRDALAHGCGPAGATVVGTVLDVVVTLVPAEVGAAAVVAAEVAVAGADPAFVVDELDGLNRLQPDTDNDTTATAMIVRTNLRAVRDLLTMIGRYSERQPLSGGATSGSSGPQLTGQRPGGRRHRVLERTGVVDLVAQTAAHPYGHRRPER